MLNSGDPSTFAEALMYCAELACYGLLGGLIGMMGVGVLFELFRVLRDWWSR